MKKTATPFERLFAIMINPWMAAACVGFIVLSYFYLDKPIAYYFHDLDLKHNFHALNWLTQLGSSNLCLGFLVLLAVFFRYIRHNKTAELRTWFLAVCVVLTSVICLVLKITLGRARPDLLFSEHLYGFYGLHTHSTFWSLPSGHTSTLMGLVFGLMVLFPYIIAFLLVAFTVVASRILLTQHFLSDVLTAAYLALLEIGFLVRFLLHKKYLINKPNGDITVVGAS